MYIMQSQYQSLLGTYEPFDVLEANNVLIHDSLTVTGKTLLNSLDLPIGGGLGRVLTSDEFGHATWEEPIK